MNINTNINALVAENAYAAAAYRNFNASSKCARLDQGNF